MAKSKEKTIWQILSSKNPESITLEEVKKAMQGVNPDRTSYSGMGTPLCYATRTGRLDIVRYFVMSLSDLLFRKTSREFHVHNYGGVHGINNSPDRFRTFRNDFFDANHPL